MIDVLIIGAGPAGLSAAIYTERAGKHAVCLEALTVGGQIVNTPEIENYPGIKKTSGFEFSMALFEQATELGAEIVYEKAARIEEKPGSDTDKGTYVVTTQSGKEFECRSVILATGAKNRHLGLAREEELLGKGISYCATCDGAFFKGKDVAVNGGGNTALEDALFLSNYCRKVYIIHRRDQFRGEPKNLEALKDKDNIEYILDSTVTELIGDDRLEKIAVKNKNTGDIKELPVSGLFIAIGQEPDNKPFAGVVELDEKGYIKANESCKTQMSGVFVAGDCRTKAVRQLTTAASDGAVAALAACEYIG
ncbi:MAG: thioredoxin-disulfide reductase [Eubacterium sp.]|nr:thioredoxin-disulfide reductase [Eubacterium sp.]MCR4845669.1 thioredoxin-disulfide reductase [Eubacterium sp.]